MLRPLELRHFANDAYLAIPSRPQDALGSHRLAVINLRARVLCPLTPEEEGGEERGGEVCHSATKKINGRKMRLPSFLPSSVDEAEIRMGKRRESHLTTSAPKSSHYH